MTLVGEIDIASAPAIAASLEVADRGIGVVLLDVSGVTFIDCFALGVLEVARRDLEAHRTRLAIAGASPWFREVCELAGYEELAAAAADGPPA